MTIKYADKIVGYEVDVAVRASMVMEIRETFHFRGSLSNAKRKAMLKSGAIRIIEARPLTDEQWCRAYGIQQRM